LDTAVFIATDHIFAAFATDSRGQYEGVKAGAAGTSFALLIVPQRSSGACSRRPIIRPAVLLVVLSCLHGSFVVAAIEVLASRPLLYCPGLCLAPSHWRTSGRQQFGGVGIRPVRRVTRSYTEGRDGGA